METVDGRRKNVYRGSPVIAQARMRSGISPAPKMRPAPGARVREGVEGSTFILDFKN